MDFVIFLLEHVLHFGVASVPFVIVFLHLKVIKLSSKVTLFVLLLNLLVSVFFWLKIKDIFLTIYQSVPYVSSLLWIWAENRLRKSDKDNKSEENKGNKNSIS